MIDYTKNRNPETSNKYIMTKEINLTNIIRTICCLNSIYLIKIETY